MKPIIIESGGGKGRFAENFVVNNIIDRIYSVGYFGGITSDIVSKVNQHATNNKILISQELAGETRVINSLSNTDDPSLAERLLKADDPLDVIVDRNNQSGPYSITILTTEEMIRLLKSDDFFAAEGDAYVNSRITGYDLASISGYCVLLTEKSSKLAMIFAVDFDESDGQRKVVLTTPVWIDVETLVNPFEPELPCYILFEGSHSPIVKVKYPIYDFSGVSSGSSQDDEVMKSFCDILGIRKPGLLSEIITTRYIEEKIKTLRDSKTLDDFYSSLGTKDSKFLPKFVKWYNSITTGSNLSGVKAGNSKVSSEEIIVAKNFTTKVFSFSPLLRLLNSSKETIIDSLSSFLWIDIPGEGKSKGGIPLSLYSGMMSTTFSNIMPLYAPNPSLDPFGGDSFYEMIGGVFCFTPAFINGSRKIGDSSWVGSRVSGRQVLHCLTAFMTLNNDFFSFSFFNEGKNVIVKQYLDQKKESFAGFVIGETEEILNKLGLRIIREELLTSKSALGTYKNEIPKTYNLIEKLADGGKGWQSC